MHAVIVAGGLGTRLRPLTERHPKHLLPVAGVPFLAHQIAALAAAGISEVVLATSYRAEAFESTFGDGSAYGVSLVYATERQPLGTGGAIRNAAELLDAGPGEPVVVLNGDILSGHDIAAQVQRHRQMGADVTLALVEVGDARPFGCVPTDEAGWVTGFVEKSADPVSRQINAGCYVFTRSVIDSIPAGRVVSVERETFPGLLAEGRRVLGDLHSAYWLDVGTPAALVTASRDLVCGTATSPAYQRPPAERLLLAGAEVAPEASVVRGSTLGAGAQVGPAAVVDGSIVADGAEIGAGARVVDSVVATGARVGDRSVLVGCVVGDAAVVGSDCDLRADVRIDCDAVVPAGEVRSGDAAGPVQLKTP
jgi:mannose-1-phosphate guanylyltransferase